MRHHRVFPHAQERAGQLAGALAPRDLSTVLWAYGRLQIYPGVEVMEALILAQRACPCPSTRLRCGPWTCCLDQAWACLDRMARQHTACHSVEGTWQAAACSLAWIQPWPWSDAPVDKLAECVCGGTRLQGVQNIAVACASLLHHPGELLDAIAADVASRPASYECMDYTGIVWAFTAPGPVPRAPIRRASLRGAQRHSMPDIETGSPGSGLALCLQLPGDLQTRLVCAFCHAGWLEKQARLKKWAALRSRHIVGGASVMLP